MRSCQLMAQNDTSWSQEDPPSLKLRRGKQFMAKNDKSWLAAFAPAGMIIRPARYLFSSTESD